MKELKDYIKESYKESFIDSASLYESNDYPDEYSKAMHSMYVNWVKLTYKSDKNKDDIENLARLQDTLANSDWFDHERELKQKREKKKNEPWEITPKDTPEQRQREKNWAEAIAIYNTLNDVVRSKDWPLTGAYGAEDLVRINIYKDSPEIKKFLQGEIKFSTKKNHEYRVPRQIEKPSKETIENLNFANTVAMVALEATKWSKSKGKKERMFEINMKNIDDKKSFNLIYRDENNEGEFNEFIEELVKKFKGLLTSKEFVPIKNVYKEYHNATGNERSNNYYYTQKRATTHADPSSISTKDVLYIKFPVIEYLKMKS